MMRDDVKKFPTSLIDLTILFIYYYFVVIYISKSFVLNFTSRSNHSLFCDDQISHVFNLMNTSKLF